MVPFLAFWDPFSTTGIVLTHQNILHFWHPAKIVPGNSQLVISFQANIGLQCLRKSMNTVSCIYVPPATVPLLQHDEVIKWKHFPRYWPFVRGIHRSPVNSPHKGQWRGALRLNKRLNEQSWGWGFKTPSCPLWRHCNGFAATWVIIHKSLNASCMDTAMSLPR